MNDRDIQPEKFEEIAARFTKFIARYFEKLPEYPPLAKVKPGELKKMLPEDFPVKGEDLETILADVEKLILPALTHWNHPRFMAYFNSTSTAPGIFGEYLAAAFNSNGMLWKTSPASAELEERSLRWFADMLGVGRELFPVVYDTASVSTMHALAAAREYVFPEVAKRQGVRVLPPIRIYASEEAHSSIEKAVITLGFGSDSLRKIPVGENLAMSPEKLKKALEDDAKKGIVPLAVVATVGTTSTTAIDPVKEIAEIISGKRVWLHIDAAYAGSAAIVPELKEKVVAGWDKADSIVVNPHKWLFVPIDFSVLFIRRPEILKAAFSLVPEYLKTGEGSAAIDYMDYGLQLGRRFRALKFWFTLRYFGKEGLESILRRHVALAKKFAEFIDNDERFELLAPVDFGVVVFRAVAGKIGESETNVFNENLLDEINRSGKVFLSHTKVKGKYAIRISISGVRTFENDVETAKDVIIASYEKTVRKFQARKRKA